MRVPALQRWSIIALVVILVVTAAVIILDREFSPLLRKQAIRMLSDRFDSEVEIRDFHASLWGLQVKGGGLVIRLHGRHDVPPLLSIEQFSADADILELLGKHWHIHKIEVKGLALQIPPRQDRPSDVSVKGHGIPVAVDELISENSRLVLIPSKPGKDPHVFDIHRLVMKNLGKGRAASFQTSLTNATPPGEIQSAGAFGPWDKEDPSNTPVHGTYTFAHADLGVFHGISGMLSSTGKYDGPLDTMQVEGETSIPDFVVSIAGHPVQLSTQYNATVDGANGDTLLHPVVAKFLHSTLICKGGVVKPGKGKGKEIKLHVVATEARLEDLLALAVKAKTAPMSGAVKLNTDFDLPTGPEDISDRLRLKGDFIILHGRFARETVRDKIKALSRRGLGKPKDDDAGSDLSNLTGQFTLGDGILSFSNLTFEVSGARVNLHGTYALKNEQFNLHGHLILDAKLSQTTTGMKSWILKAVDPFFRKNGHTMLPIKITGSRDKPSFGLDL
jgi:hypothetical protein